MRAYLSIQLEEMNRVGSLYKDIGVIFKHTCATLLLGRNVNPRNRLGDAGARHHCRQPAHIYSHVSSGMRDGGARALEDALL